MRSAVILLALLVPLAASAPAAAEVVVDFSWLSFTGVETGTVGTMAGGQVSGRDPAARWDPVAGTFRFVHDGQAFESTFLRAGETVWNHPMEVPTHPAFLAANGGHRASTLVTIEETATGFTATGVHGSMFERVGFSGTATARAVAAFEPGAVGLLVAVGLAAAGAARRRPPDAR